MHSGQYAFRDRRQKKRDFRRLWIVRINAACRENEISYSRFIEGLNKAGVEINRKMLSEIAINDPKAFAELVKTAKAGKEGKITKQEVKPVKAAAKNEEKVAKEEATDLSKLTVAELKKMASEKNIAGASTMKKAELLDALK